MANTEKKIENLLEKVSLRLSSASKDHAEAMGFLAEAIALETDPDRLKVMKDAKQKLTVNQASVVVPLASAILALHPQQ